MTASFVPRWNRIFHDACIRHDYCYMYGKFTYGKSKSDCDKALYEDAKKICLRDFSVSAQPNCLKNAEAYYRGVQVFGEQYFASNGTLTCQYPDRMTSRAERKTITACPSYGWQKTSAGKVPSGAVKGGQEPGRVLYVCRASYQDGEHPGKVVGQNCNIGYAGKEVSIPEYEMLIMPSSKTLRWVTASEGAIPTGAIKGGQEPGRDLYICRAAYKGGVHPGKVVGKTCNIGYGGTEASISIYEVPVL